MKNILKNREGFMQLLVDEGNPILRNLNLCVGQGEHVVIVGESGSGKST